MHDLQGDPRRTTRVGRLRWLIRAGVAAIALWLIADGLLGIWPDAGTTTRVVIVVAVVVGLVAAGVGALMLARRDRSPLSSAGAAEVRRPLLDERPHALAALGVGGGLRDQPRLVVQLLVQGADRGPADQGAGAHHRPDRAGGDLVRELRSAGVAQVLVLDQARRPGRTGAPRRR